MNFGAVKSRQNKLNAAFFFAACALAGLASFFYFYNFYKPVEAKPEAVPTISSQAEALFKTISRLDYKNNRQKFAEKLNSLIGLWPDSMSLFEQKLRSGNESERYAVLMVLEQVRDRRALPLLVDNARLATDPVLRAGLLELSGRIGWFQESYLREKLTPFLKDSNGTVSNAAAFALVSIGCDEGRQSLLDNLKSSDEATRLGALERLDVSRSYEAAETLASMLPENPASPSEIALARKITEALTVFRYLPPRVRIASYLRHESFVLRQFAIEYLFNLKPADCLPKVGEAFDYWRANEKMKDDLVSRTSLVQMAGLVCALKGDASNDNFPAREFLSGLLKNNQEKKQTDAMGSMAQSAMKIMGKSGDKFFAPILLDVIRESSNDDVLRTAHQSLQALTYANFLSPEKKSFTREEVVALWENWWAKHKDESRPAWLRLSVDRNLALMVLNQAKGVAASEIFSRVFEPNIRPLVFCTFAYPASRNKEDYEYCLYRWEKWWKEKRPLTRRDWRADELQFAFEQLLSPEPDLRCWGYGTLMGEGMFAPVQTPIFWREAPADLRSQAAAYWKKRYEMVRDNPDFAPVGDQY